MESNAERLAAADNLAARAEDLRSVQGASGRRWLTTDTPRAEGPGEPRAPGGTQSTRPSGNARGQAVDLAGRSAGRARQPSATGPHRSVASHFRGFTDLADRLASLGPAAVEEELSRFIEHARERGVTPLLLSIVACGGQPDIVRQRAFGRIVAALERQRRTRWHGARGSDTA